MSDEEGQELVNKPFKFVTDTNIGLFQAPTLDSPTRTRPSTAGKTMSTTTSASSPRARTLPLAASVVLALLPFIVPLWLVSALGRAARGWKLPREARCLDECVVYGIGGDRRMELQRAASVLLADIARQYTENLTLLYHIRNAI
ncbi:hypothetical protein Golomagni_07231 [Golovinomyces magnicellulatus]|nr:hypothetical protein Golomagni_07231 [Golovinomyces magnicellulatus]